MSRGNWSNTLFRGLIEGLLVFLGVLLGFYFENLREQKEQFELLQRDLKILSFEITENGDIGEFTVEFADSEMKKLDSLLAAIPNMSKTDLVYLVPDQIGWYGNAETKLYAFEMMLNNGSLSLIKNDELLRKIMIDYPAARADMFSVISENEPYVTDLSKPYEEVLFNARTRILMALKSSSLVYNYSSLVVQIDSLITVELGES